MVLIAYAEIAAALIVPAGASERYKKLNALDRLLDGTFYDDIAWAFETETLHGEYLSLVKRRPSVKVNLARIVMDQSSGSLWADDEIAKIICGVDTIDDDGDAQDQKNVDALFVDCQLDAVMMEVYERSGAGSAAVMLDIDADTKAPTFTCIQGKYLRPHWASRGSQKLTGLEYVYPTTAKELRAAGEVIDPDIADTSGYWNRIIYTDKAELHFTALSAYDYEHLGEPEANDPTQTIAWHLKPKGVYPHRWGVVPAVYVRCLLFGDSDDDGRCPYADIADIQVEIARLLSQVGRGFRYAADPLLVRQRGEIGMATKGMAGNGLDVFGGEEMRGSDGQTIRSVSNVLEGEAKLLEITGTGLAQAVEYTKVLREWALEVAGAMKADAASTRGAMSGRALDMLQKMLRLLVKRQRIAYGQRGLVPLIRLILKGCAAGLIKIDGVINPDPAMRIRLEWPKDSVDAEMIEDEHEAKLNAIRINSGVMTPNEWRDEDDLDPLPHGDKPYLPGKGPWSGESILGTKPDDTAAIPAEGTSLPAMPVSGAAEESPTPATAPTTTPPNTSSVTGGVGDPSATMHRSISQTKSPRRKRKPKGQ